MLIAAVLAAVIVLVGAATPGVATAKDAPDCAPQGEGPWVSDQGFKPFRIWYHEHPEDNLAPNYLKDRAHRLAQELDLTIWPKLTELMGVEPVAKPLNICLVTNENLPKESGGVAVPTEEGCSHVPSYVELPDRGQFDLVKVTLAHEFMHVLQYSLNVGCDNSYWWRESTAEWAQDYIYPDDNEEHSLAQYYLKDMDQPLPGKCDPCGEFSGGRDRQYGSYVFPFFIARSIQPDLIGRIWRHAQSESILEAIDEVLPGGLKKQWPEFAKDAWNKDPVDDFNKWDDLDKGAHTYTKDKTLSPGSDEPLDDVADLKRLSVKYFNFKVDSGVRTLAVTIPSPYAGGILGQKADPHAKMQAIIELAGGSAEVQDWTNDPYKNYCFALPHQKVTGLTLVFSNSNINDDFQDKQPGYVVATDVGCKQWTGTISAEIDNPFDVQGLTFKSTAHVTYRREDPTPDGSLFYVPVSGGANWTGSGTTHVGDETCKYDGSGSWDVTKDVGYITMEWGLHSAGNVINPRFYSGDLGGPLFYFINGTCTDAGGSDPSTADASLPAWSTGSTNMSVSGSGLSMHGHYGDSDGKGAAETWDWTLTSSG